MNTDETAGKQDTACRPTSDEEHDQRFNLIIHGTLLAILLWVLLWFIPGTFELFSAGSHQPKGYLLVASISSKLRAWSVVVLPSAAFLLWIDLRHYTRIYRRNGRFSAQRWSLMVFLGLVAAVTLSLWPVFSIFMVLSDIRAVSP